MSNFLSNFNVVLAKAEEFTIPGHDIQAEPDGLGEVKAAVLMRKYACCYAQGRRGAREFRKRVATILTPAEFHEVVEAYFPRDV